MLRSDHRKLRKVYGVGGMCPNNKAAKNNFYRISLHKINRDVTGVWKKCGKDLVKRKDL